MPGRHRHLASLALVAGCAVSASVLFGCASGSPVSGVGAVARLERMADTGATDRQARSAPLAPGLDAESLSRVSDDKATLPVSEVLTLVRTEEAESEAPIAVDRAPTVDSLMLYISGRSRRLAGDLEGALAELQAAAKADPTAPEPWREIGEAQRRLGDRLSAAAAFRQALRLDPGDTVSRLQVGLWSLERRDAASAARHLAHAREQAPKYGDPALLFIVDAGLGRALLDLGYLRAGFELLTAGLSAPETLDSPTAFQPELELLLRQRGDSWRDAGDAAIRLGDYPAALRAYQRASTLPTLDPAGLLPRFVYAAMKTGHTALAAVALLDALEAGSDIAGDRLLPLIRYIGAHSSVGPLLKNAIDARREALTSIEQTRLASLYARAAAAALPDAESARALRAWLAVHPNDEGAVRDLFRLGDGDALRMVAETIRLIEEAPLNEKRYAETLTRLAPSFEELFDVLEPQASPAAVMLQARLLQEAGRSGDAAAALRPMVTARRHSGAVGTALLIELLAEAGEVDEAISLLERFEGPDSPELRLLKSRALAAIGRADEAYEALLPAIEPADGAPAPFAGHPNEIDAVLLAADLAWRIGDAAAVERWARVAIELNPSIEQAYARLIDLYNRSGPMPDSDKLTAAVRQLREAAPSSRTLRWLRAQELVATGQYDQAERDLLSLAEQEPTEPVVELLTTIWLTTGSASRAEGWLRHQIEAHPAHPAPTHALARLLSDDDRPEQAVALLEDWLTKRPYDTTAARQLESVLRDKLKRIDEADQRALRRLEAQPPSFNRAVELADVLIRQDAAERAAEELIATIDAAPPISAPLGRAFLRVLFLLNQEAIEGKIPLSPALRLSQIAFERFPQLPIELHDQHLNLLAQSDASYDETVAVLDAALARFRERSPEIAYVTVGRLLAGQHSRLALRVAEHVYPQLRAKSDPRFLHAWISATVLEKDSDAAIDAIRAITRDDLAVPLLKLYPQFPLGEPSPGRRGHAELAMVVGDLFSSEEAPYEDVVALYDLAMEFDPNHETLNNNYGYYLADRGIRLDDAERFILRSLAVRPDDPFALDSLAWARYKQGVIHDERDETGGVIREGAVSILERASVIGVNRTSAEVHEHFGDALWAAGDHERAVSRWRAVQSLLEETLSQRHGLRTQAEQLLERRPGDAAGIQREMGQIDRAIAQTQADLDRIKSKIAAAQSGAEPEIAEIVGRVNAPPPDGE